MSPASRGAGGAALPQGPSPPMTTYIIGRVLRGIVLLLAVSALTFVLFNILPSGDPATLRAGRSASPQAIVHVRHDLGLDKPVFTQFIDYMKGIVLHFNLGYSYYSEAPVKSLIAGRLPATLSLAAGAGLLWVLAGIPVGVISALGRRTRLDRVAMRTALVLVSMPVFWLALMVLFLFGSAVGKLPLLPGANTYAGLTVNPGKWLGSLILPWLVLAASFAAIYSRLLRARLSEAMGEDYIRTARAKGLSERRVICLHGLRSALTPVLTIFGLEIGVLLGGVLITETVFDIPGIGRLNYDAILHANFPIVQGTVLLAAMLIVVVNVIADTINAYLDPRARYGIRSR